MKPVGKIDQRRQTFADVADVFDDGGADCFFSGVFDL